MQLDLTWFRSRRRLRRWIIAVLTVLIVWLLVSSVVAFCLTRRPRARFEEPAPSVAWGPLEDHRITTRDGQEIGAWFVMGAAAAVFAAGELGHRIQGYILESPYQDLKTAVWNRTEVNLPPVLSHAAYAGLRIVGPLFLPDLDKISPLNAIAGIPNDVPVLILAGDADRLARPEEAQALYHEVAAHGRLLLFPGAGHGNLFGSAPSLYARTVLEFCGEISKP